jgi:hypothetical protein
MIIPKIVREAKKSRWRVNLVSFRKRFIAVRNLKKSSRSERLGARARQIKNWTAADEND